MLEVVVVVGGGGFLVVSISASASVSVFSLSEGKRLRDQHHPAERHQAGQLVLPGERLVGHEQRHGVAGQDGRQEGEHRCFG